MIETTESIEPESTVRNPVLVEIDVLPQHLNYRCNDRDLPQFSGFKFASYMQSQIERWLLAAHMNFEINVFYVANPNVDRRPDMPLTRFIDGPESVRSYIYQVINVIWSASINKFQSCQTRNDLDRLYDREIHGVTHV